MLAKWLTIYVLCYITGWIFATLGEGKLYGTAHAMEIIPHKPKNPFQDPKQYPLSSI